MQEQCVTVLVIVEQLVIIYFYTCIMYPDKTSDKK